MTPSYLAVRLPFAPLEALAIAAVNEPPALPGNHLSGRTLRKIAERLGVNIRYVYRCRRDGVRWDRADRMATTLGYHPAEVWGDAWWALGETA